MSNDFVLISAGGTGGHMSPASALASDLKSRGVRVELATDDRGAKFSAMFDGLPIHVVKSGTAGAGIKGKIKGAVNLALGILQARKLVKSLNPDLVIGFGGYPSVPAVFAAQSIGTPTILHEQNATLGKANDFLKNKAKCIALSLPINSEFKTKSVVTGNPVRPEITDLYDNDYPETGNLNIFIMGGSLGATIFSDVVPHALAQLSDDHKSLINITQQCRKSDIDGAQDVYKHAGINANLATFFDDIAGELSNAHLIIARSGASTVAEVAIAGRPAIYVPYPHHKDQQQKKNAESIVSSGGAWLMEQDDFTIDALLQQIKIFLQNPETLQIAAANAKTCAKPDAAKKLGDLVVKTIADFK